MSDPDVYEVKFAYWPERSVRAGPPLTHEQELRLGRLSSFGLPDDMLMSRARQLSRTWRGSVGYMLSKSLPSGWGTVGAQPDLSPIDGSPKYSCAKGDSNPHGVTH